MERVVIKRRGGLQPSEFEIWIGEQRVEGVISYQVTERYKEIPKVTFTVEASELIEDIEFDFANVEFIGEANADSKS